MLAGGVSGSLGPVWVEEDVLSWTIARRLQVFNGTIRESFLPGMGYDLEEARFKFIAVG